MISLLDSAYIFPNNNYSVPKNDFMHNTEKYVKERNYIWQLYYVYLSSVNRVNIYSGDIRFCQSEAYDIYDELIYTFDGSEPDMSENSVQMFTYYDYREALNISENRCLISIKTEW